MKVIKQFLKLAGIMTFLLLLGTQSFGYTVKSFNCDLRNDVLVSANVYEFDIYLLNTSPDPEGDGIFEYANMQFGINVPAAFKGSGTITVTLVPGSSELNPQQVPPAAKFSFQPLRNCIIMTATPNSTGAGTGKIISYTAPGTRVGRIRLTSTASFGLTCPMNLTWCYATSCGYPTKISAYQNALATEVTNLGTITTNLLCNPCINKPLTSYTVTPATGDYCAGGNGVVVGLSGSEFGVTYTMNPGAVVLPGTGNPLIFGSQMAETYTVSAVRNCTYINGPMGGSAIITEIPLPDPAGMILGNTTVTEGSTGNAYLVPMIANATSYAWSVTGGVATINGTGNAVTLDFPMGQCNLTVQLHVYGVNQCGNGVESFFDIFIECAGGPPLPFDVTGGGPYCAGNTPPLVGLSGSEIGVDYELLQDGLPMLPAVIVPGTGFALDFGPQPGTYTYTVMGTNIFGNTLMNLSAVVTEVANYTLTNTISAPTKFCPNDQITIMCDHNYPVDHCDWYLNGSLYYTGMNLTFTPSDLDEVYCICYVDMNFWPCWTAPTAMSNTLIFTQALTSMTWNGSIDNNWHNPLNWTPNGTPECCTDVTILAGLNNYPTLNAPGACHDIFIDMGATLVDNGFLTVCGTADVKRCYTHGTEDWHLIGSPISNGLAGIFVGKYMQSYTDPNIWTDIVSVTQPLNVMEGYAMWCQDHPLCPECVNFIGNLNLGQLSKPAFPQWNLLSNPFVASIDWNGVILNGVWPSVWYLDAASGNYLVYNQTTGGTGSQWVPPTQGFFVEAYGTAASVALPNSAKSHMYGNLFYKSEDPSIVIIEAKGQNYKDQTWVRFNEQENAAFDGQTDVKKIISVANAQLPQIYTTIGNEKMTINSMPQTSTVPMGFTAVASGTFTINAPQTGLSAKVTLEDLFNGTMTDLMTGSYTFTYTTGDQENRFLLHFNGVGVGNNQADLVNIYSSEKTAYVAIPANRTGDVKIMNMLGQKVKEGKLSNVLTKFTLNEPGIYVVQASVNGKVYTQKVIIR